MSRYKEFWSSDKLTGSQTRSRAGLLITAFWSSDKLTGSQTLASHLPSDSGFGAVTN